jgi:hypothetical protein
MEKIAGSFTNAPSATETTDFFTSLTQMGE